MIPVIVRGVVTAVKTLLGYRQTIETVEEVIEVTVEAIDPEPKQPGHPLTYKQIEKMRSDEHASILASKAAAARAADKAAADKAAASKADRTLIIAQPGSTAEPISRDAPTPPAVPRLMPPRRGRPPA